MSTLTLDSLKLLYDSLPKPPQLYVGPETDMKLLAEVLNVTVLKPQGEGIAAMFSPGALIIGRDIKVRSSVLNNVVEIHDDANERIAFFDLMKREGFFWSTRQEMDGVAQEWPWPFTVSNPRMSAQIYGFDAASPNSDITVEQTTERKPDGSAEVVSERVLAHCDACGADYNSGLFSTRCPHLSIRRDLLGGNDGEY